MMNIKRTALILIIMLLISAQPISAKTRKDGGYWIFIGDSYMCCGNRRYHKTCADYIASMLHVRKYENLSKGGSGVANDNGRFIWQLRGKSINKKVTDVLIHGGIMNDHRCFCTEREIARCMKKLIERIRYLYPNARIWYVSMAYSTNRRRSKRYLRIHDRMYPLYARLAEENGVIVITNVRDILPDLKRADFESGGRHPKKRAMRIIARRLSRRIKHMKKGNGAVKRPWQAETQF